MHTIRFLRVLKRKEKNSFGYPSLCMEIKDETNGIVIPYWIHERHDVHWFLCKKLEIEKSENLLFSGFITTINLNADIIKSLKIYKDQEIVYFQPSGRFVFWDINDKDLNQIILWTLKDQLWKYVTKAKSYILFDPYYGIEMGIVNESINAIHDQLKDNFSGRNYSIMIR